jgi:hypothetical protein
MMGRVLSYAAPGTRSIPGRAGNSRFFIKMRDVRSGLSETRYDSQRTPAYATPVPPKINPLLFCGKPAGLILAGSAGLLSSRSCG